MESGTTHRRSARMARYRLFHALLCRPTMRGARCIHRVVNLRVTLTDRLQLYDRDLARGLRLIFGELRHTLRLLGVDAVVVFAADDLRFGLEFVRAVFDRDVRVVAKVEEPRRMLRSAA